MAERLLTTVVGSYPQPEWLVDRKNLRSRLPPRVRAREIWRIPEPLLQEAQDDATLLAIRDMERAGIDIISDGEMRRESYSNRFATALDGMDLDNPGVALDRTGHPNPVPRVVGPIRRLYPVEVRDVEFLRRNTDRHIFSLVNSPPLEQVKSNAPRRCYRNHWNQLNPHLFCDRRTPTEVPKCPALISQRPPCFWYR